MGSLGKEILERKLKSIKADFDEKNLDFLTKFYNYGSRLDLYLSIYLEQLNLTELKTIKIEHGKFVNEILFCIIYKTLYLTLGNHPLGGIFCSCLNFFEL